MLKRLISGGQTGADRAGLIAAKAAGIPTGGWMPRGFLAEDGRQPGFAAEYGIREHPSPQYPPRTEANVKEADGTIRFATDWGSAGVRLTLKMIQRHGKPHIDVSPARGPNPKEVAQWIRANGIGVLNVAGNSERKSPGIQEYAVGFLRDVFRILALEPS
jgi:Circularly permutated YpsA SLOG family